MIAFGTAITSPVTYEECAEPGIKRVAEPDSLVFPHQTTNSIYRNYNLIMDQAADHPDLEALVLIHQDAEIVNLDFCQNLRRALSDPEVAIVGCAGALGVRNISWWEGAVTWASFTHRYTEMGGGDFPALSYLPDEAPSLAQTGEVDSLDGVLLCLSPWAVRNLRFDESLGSLHGYDFDICCQAREAGRKVVTEDLRIIHHHSLDLASNLEYWMEAHIRLAEKWDGRVRYAGEAGGDWKTRARRAEAEAAAQHIVRVSNQMKLEVRDREIERIRRSVSWRLTAPLRWLGNLFRRDSVGQ